MIEIVQADSEERYRAVERLFLEYAEWLDYQFCFDNTDHEISRLPGVYGPPEGTLLLAYCDGKLAGCVALRRWEDGACEMKRLFVRPEFRGKKIGRNLVVAVIKEAREIGYNRMKLDTLPRMKEAIVLYKSLGFKQIGKYRISPTEDALYFELGL